MKLLILQIIFTALVLSCHGSLLGVNKCGYGPSYWCDSLMKAKECNALQHCIQSVWEKQKYPEDNDEICDICLHMVKEARDQLQSNETQEELKEVFEGSCRLIPIKEVSTECIKLADEFIPELIETLASQMNPEAVCTTAGLCNSIAVDVLLRKFKEEHPDTEIIPAKWKSNDPFPGDCEACQTFINDTIRLVKTHDRSETLNRLLSICGRLGSLSDGCMALVESNFENIYDYLSNDLKASEFCDLVGMCEKMYGDKQVTFVKSEDEGCDFCVAIVKHWRDVLTSNTTELEFKEILDGLCQQTGNFKKECRSLVDQYYLALYQMLISEVHPKEICEAVGLCGMSSIFSADIPSIWTIHQLRPENMLPIVNDFEKPKKAIDEPLIGKDELASVRLETENEIEVMSVGNRGVLKNSNDNACVMCEFTLHFIQNMLQDKPTREEIEEAVEKVCSLMPKTVAEECDDYVDAYGDQVIDLLSQEIDPSVICPMLGFCHKKLDLYKSKDNTGCVLCEFAMMQIEEKLKDNKTEAAIRHNVENVCNILPKSIHKECIKFVDNYADQVIQLLINDLDPDQICAAIGLCKKVNKIALFDTNYQLPVSRLFVPVPKVGETIEKSKDIKSNNMKQSPVCILCEFAMAQIDNELINDRDNIEKAVEFVCVHLPGTVQEDCIGFIEEYGDSIIKMLTDQLNPKEVCRELTLCKASAITKLMSATVRLDVNKCTICEQIVNFVDEKLNDPEIVTDLDTLMENICTILPPKVHDECRNFIEVYGAYVVNMLAELGHDSKKVCQAMDICPKLTKTPLLGAEKCTWGPSYWCQTQVHAKSCKATAHCEENVWKNSKPLF